MTAFYNEIDPFAAAWLRELAVRDLIAIGTVCDRSIVDLQPADVEAATQLHCFAGIGVWSYALRLAGWPDAVPIWTGSCPCQPFSTAGRKKGFSDDRHLWPAWFKLIEQCRPAIVVGEQVASPDGRRWLDAVLADLEGCGYAVGASDLPACGVGAPHQRQRLYFVAITDGERREGIRVQLRERGSRSAMLEAGRGSPASCLAGLPRPASSMADGQRARLEVEREQQARAGQGPATERGGEALDRILADDAPRGRQERREAHSADRSGSINDGSLGDCLVGDAGLEGGRRHAGAVLSPQGGSEGERIEPWHLAHVAQLASANGATRGFWRDADYVACRDPKRGIVYRPVESGAFPLAHGAPARVGRLRGYGNGLVAQVAATFLTAVVECIVGEGF